MGCLGAMRMMRALCAVAAASVLLCDAVLLVKEDARVEPFVTGVFKTRFGKYITTDGQTMAVTAIGENAWAGAIYMFKLVDGVWEPEQKLTLPNAEAGDAFGYQVRIRGDRILTGAYKRKVNGIRTGQAHVFERQADQATEPWALVATLDCTEIQVGNNCGHGSAIDDTYVYVSAEQGHTLEGATYGAGAVHIFEGSGANWTLKQTLRGENYRDEFSDDMKLGGIWMAVAAPDGDTDADNPDTGAVYMYRLNKFGKRKFGAKLVPPVLGQRRFGIVVAMSEDGKTVAVAGGKSTPTEPGSKAKTGVVFIYKIQFASWNLVEEVAPQSVLETGDKFGCRVNFVGNLLVVAAKGDDKRSGAVHLFRRLFGKWEYARSYVLSTRVAGDDFGTAMDAGGSWLAVGASEFSSDPTQRLRDGLVQMYEIVDSA